jgi:cytoskeletal protein RodZ
MILNIGTPRKGVEVFRPRNWINLSPRSLFMKMLPVSAVLMAAGLLVASPLYAQTNTDTAKPPASSAQKQKTQDGNSPTTVGPGSAAYKQRTQDGNSPTTVGPGSAAYKQKTQSLSHGDPGSMKQN